MRNQPDIIWIYCDELRTDALGCYGHPTLQLHTPNLDRLATAGVRFTNNFCNSPVCVSSRCCVLTGLHPEASGVYNNEAAWMNFRLPRPLDTFPRQFAQHGYTTASFGKLHVARGMYPGETADYDIFQYNDSTGGSMKIWQHLGEAAVQMIRAPNGGMHGGVYPDAEAYPPDAVTENALRWIDRADNSPFLLRISLLQPHTPVLPPAAYVKLFADQDPGLPTLEFTGLSAFEQRVAQVHGLDRMSPQALRLARIHYYAQVAWVDAQVGRVLDYLEHHGRLQQTILVFGADHGNPIGDTGAFEKHTFTPSVHRVPQLITWPGTIAAGQVRDDICDSLDLGNTLFALAGIPAPAQFKGRNLFGSPEPDAIFSTIGFGQPDSKLGPNGGRGQWQDGRGWPRRSCIRTNRFRLDKNMRIDAAKCSPADEDVFLADVQSDPAEFTNRAAEPQFAQVVRELSALLDKHAEGAVEVAPEYLQR